MNFLTRLFGNKKPKPAEEPTLPSERIIQFLIRRTDGEWFDLHVDRFKDVLKPPSTASRVIDGWGDHRIEVCGCEVSFSYEDPGIQVCFESGEITDVEAQRLVEEIASSLTLATGQQSRVVAL